MRTEYRLDVHNRPSADLYVEFHTDEGDHLIEMKRALPNLKAQDIKRQLERYHKAMEMGLGRTRERTFLCIVGEDTEPATYGESRKS